MKKIPYLLFVAFVLTLSACSNDDDNPDVNLQENFLKIGDTEYVLKAGSIEDFGLYQSGLYNFDITLITSTVTNVGGEFVPQDQIISGIYFELYTNTENDLSEGTYSKVDFEDIGHQTFEYAEIAEGVDASTEDETGTFTELIQGSIEVISNGPEYEFQFSGVDNLGQNISGYYKGSLVYEDVSE